MFFFQGAINLVRGFFSRSENATTGQPVHYPAETRAMTRQQELTGARRAPDGPRAKCGQWLNSIDRPPKRKISDLDEVITPKRVRMVYGEHSTSLVTSLDGDVDDVLERRGQRYTNKRSDRELMPPPATPLDHKKLSSHRNQSKRQSLGTNDTFSEARSHVTKHSEIDNEYDMEAARRRAAATHLPPNSGIWEPAEKDLFFHLAYRGFEPLLPHNWMIDFPTLPISLFATRPDQIPLISNHISTEFRAIKALQDLINTGITLRDRTLSPRTKLRKEPIIEKAANKYIKWSLEDIGISSKRCIPVHAVVAMKAGQTTLDTIRELTVKMHHLSARHRQECDIITSVERERDDSPSSHNNETRLNRDRIDSDEKLPVIYGLMVCSSLLAIFTLSSHTPPPRFITREQNRARNINPKSKSKTAAPQPNSDATPDQDIDDNHPNNKEDNEEDDEDNNESSNEEDNEDSGLRFIHSFDFSDSAADVWNAFVIAIVAVTIRKTLADIYGIPHLLTDQQENDQHVPETSSLAPDNEIGASQEHDNVQHETGGGTLNVFHAGDSVVEDEDDPDL